MQASPASAMGWGPSFRSIYDAELNYVWQSLRRLGVRPSDLEDVAHDVFVTVHRKLSDYDPFRPLRPWLFGIAFRIASDYRRTSRFQREVFDGEPEREDPSPSVDAQLETMEAHRLVMAALDTINLDQRAVFILHELDGQTAPEVATALGVPLNTVYSRLRLARKAFASAVAHLQGAQGAQARS
ncbi:RNA polymerase sigma factor [Pendulispora albinea]|uniref:Sigma-70 family RNA polymerase sigma factor n=1 Tax=Pendulispora albinea TaxID=2741071 RepID=A0ABZ2LRR3_9BACT